MEPALITTTNSSSNGHSSKSIQRNDSKLAIITTSALPSSASSNSNSSISDNRHHHHYNHDDLARKVVQPTKEEDAEEEDEEAGVSVASRASKVLPTTPENQASGKDCSGESSVRQISNTENGNNNSSNSSSQCEHCRGKPISAVPKSKFTAFRRTRSLNAPSPICQFGPCGSISKNTAMVMTIQDPASQRLTWNKLPSSVLVIKKIHDSLIIQPFLDLVQWLIWDKEMTVYVEASVLEDVHLKTHPLFVPIKDKFRTFRDGKDDLTDKIDFIVCLGGDGTLLYASSLFQESVPPVMAFHMGSLGFLTPFEFDNFQQQIANVLKGNAALTLRSRLRCTVLRQDKGGDSMMMLTVNGNGVANGGAAAAGNGGTGNADNKSTVHLVLNEMVVDRGPSPYLSNVDLYIDGKHITTVQGDGLIVSTPTGSTAYAVAAGASMIHPSVPAIMITPICPHSLSFRPIVVPAGVQLKICVSPDSRNSAWVSFDGRNRQEIQVGDSVRVTTSIFPVPSICAEDQIGDWFDSLAECLHWNVRQKQKQFDEYSDLIHSSSSDSLDK